MEGYVTNAKEILRRPVREKLLFNQEGKKFCNIIGCESDGVIDFVDPDYKWAANLWDQMIANTWFPSEVSLSKDKILFEKLPNNLKAIYKTNLAQLIANDSIQTNQLQDRINPYITSPIVNAVISRQAWEEANHSKSYAVLGEEVLDYFDKKEIYTLNKKNRYLYNKNKEVSKMFEQLYKSDRKIVSFLSKETNEKIINFLEEKLNVRFEPTIGDLLLAFVANNVLERMIFYPGFTLMWWFGEEHGLLGTAKMIQFIERDEYTHVVLFKNIFRTAVKELLVDTKHLPEEFIERIYKLLKHMTWVEINWMLYLAKQANINGFNEDTISQFIQDKANSICKNLGIDKLYPDVKDGGLIETFVDKWSLVGKDNKTSFFESKVADYSLGTLIMDI